MNAMAAPVPAATIPGFGSIVRRVLEFIVPQVKTTQDDDRRLVRCTPLAVLGP